MLKIAGLTKRYGGVEALRGVSMELGPGRVLGLVGENGAGKSTLMKCVAGIERPTSGSVSLDGVCYMVPQEFMLADTLSVADNIFLGREVARFGLLDRKGMRAVAAGLLAQIGADVDPGAVVGGLSVAKKQMVEIAKAFLVRASLIIFDEPTTTLNRMEAERLFKVIRSFRESGGSAIFVSHKLDEVLEICDDVAVLRDGELVSICGAGELTQVELANRMVGRQLSRMFPGKLRDPAPGAQAALRAERLSDGGSVRDVSLELHEGEILGMAGLSGAGRTELAELICGMRPRKGGRLFVFGKERKFSSMHEAQEAGVAYISEDRQGTALVADFEVRENSTLGSIERHMIGPIVSGRSRAAAARKYVEELSIKCPGVAASVRALSGGNQQKVALAKGLDAAPRILIFDEPTRGVDIGAKADIYGIVNRLARAGMAVLLISSDLPEIIGNCGRAVVMREGRVAGEVSGAAMNEQAIMQLATGAR